MITFKQFVTEVLDKPLPFEVIEDSHTRFVVSFKAGDREIIFLADNEGAMDDDDQDDWEISFGQKVRKQTEGGYGYDTFNYDKTKSGKEFDVFATLKAILEKFIKQKKPVQIRFTADKNDGNRARLYAKMFKKNMPAGWRLDQQDSEGGYIQHTEFAMVKE